MKALIGRLVVGTLLAWTGLLAQPAMAQDTIKVAYIDPLSGPFASSGDQFLKVFNYILADINARGGAMGKKFELVPFDDKLQPSEALIALKSVTDQNIWLQQVGDNLQVDLMGSSDQLTIDDWFGGSNPAAVQGFATSDGLKLDTQVSQLVSAMATYATDNPAFNPTAVSQIPTDSSLQSAVAAAWHH